jgi:hypothetical protein
MIRGSGAREGKGGRMPLCGTALVGLRPEPLKRLGHSATIDFRKRRD